MLKCYLLFFSFTNLWLKVQTFSIMEIIKVKLNILQRAIHLTIKRWFCHFVKMSYYFHLPLQKSFFVYSRWRNGGIWSEHWNVCVSILEFVKSLKVALSQVTHCVFDSPWTGYITSGPWSLWLPLDGIHHKWPMESLTPPGRDPGCLL